MTQVYFSLSQELDATDYTDKGGAELSKFSSKAQLLFWLHYTRQLGLYKFFFNFLQDCSYLLKNPQ